MKYNCWPQQTYCVRGMGLLEDMDKEGLLENMDKEGLLEDMDREGLLEDSYMDRPFYIIIH